MWERESSLKSIYSTKTSPPIIQGSEDSPILEGLLEPNLKPIKMTKTPPIIQGNEYCAVVEGMPEPSLKPINTTRTPPIIQGNEDCAIVEGMPEKDVVTEPLSPWSKAFHDSVLNIYILAIIGSQTPLDVNKGKRLIREWIVKHPRFSSIVVGEKRDELKWVTISKLQLDDLLVVPFIDPAITPGSKMADKYVEDYMYNLSNERLVKSSRPLWDLHFLKLKTSKHEGVIIFRAHHSLGDGASLMSFLLACSNNKFDPTILPTFPVSNKKMKKEIVRPSSMLKCWRVLVWLWWVLVLLWNTSVDGLNFLATICFLKDTNTPIKGRSSTALRPKRFVYRAVCLDDIKLIKNMMNVTINDVAIAITQAGLSCYLNRKYTAAYDNCYKAEDKETKKKKVKNKLPGNIRLRSMLMVNIRPQGIQDFSELMKNNSRAKWGNLMGFFLMPFTIRLQDDPLDYVRQAKIITDRRKHSLESTITYLSFKIIPMLFGFKVLKALIERACANTTLIFSNVVGPSEDILFCGHHIDVIAATCYGHTQASMITFTSCGNQMALAASIDEDTIADPEQLCDDIVECLNIIKEAVVAPLP